MRVVFLNSRLSQRGGADRWLLELVSLLRRRGVETAVVAGHDDGSLEACERKLLGPVTIFKGLDRGRPGRPRRLHRHEALVKLLGDMNPELVNINDVVEPAAISAVVREFPTVFTVQDHRFFCPGPGKVLPDGTCCEHTAGERCLDCFTNRDYARYMLRLTRERMEALRGAAHFVTLSRYMRGQLLLAGIPSAKISVVPPAVASKGNAQACQEWPTNVGERNLHLFAARLCRHKGIDTVCRAARMLPEGHRLLVAGDGPASKEIEEMSRNEPKIVYLGWTRHSRMRELFERVKTFWMPVRWAEPFGIAGVEALAHGVPVIATPRGGIVEWLEDGTTGLFVEPEHPENLAKHAAELASDERRLSLYSANAKSLVRRRFSTGRWEAEMIAVYEKTRTL